MILWGINYPTLIPEVIPFGERVDAPPEHLPTPFGPKRKLARSVVPLSADGDSELDGQTGETKYTKSGNQWSQRGLLLSKKFIL